MNHASDDEGESEAATILSVRSLIVKLREQCYNNWQFKNVFESINSLGGDKAC